MQYKKARVTWPDKPVTEVLALTEGGRIWSIPFDPANTDYQAYLKWLAEGNEPLPADTPEQQA